MLPEISHLHCNSINMATEVLEQCAQILLYKKKKNDRNFYKGLFVHQDTGIMKQLKSTKCS